MTLPPLIIHIMLACYISPEPAEMIGLKTWDSSSGKEFRKTLIEAGLIDEDNRATARGKQWAQSICSTPLPLNAWRDEDDPTPARARPARARAQPHSANIVSESILRRRRAQRFQGLDGDGGPRRG